MKYYQLFLVAILSSCSITKYQKKGETYPAKFHDSIMFSTAKSIILIPAVVDDETKNFLFDTGAQLNLIQRDEPKGRKAKVAGASDRKTKLGSEITKSLKIGQIAFLNTASWNGNLEGLKEQIPNFGGIIGQSVISKANWKIDYPNKVLEISDQPFPHSTFKPIDIKREEGTPYVFITIEKVKHKAVIDLGSSSRGINVPDNHPLADELLKKYSFENNTREIYSLGGNQLVKEKIGTIPSVSLNDIRFNDVQVDIRRSSQLRIGMNFFKDCILIIDNSTGDYLVKK